VTTRVYLLFEREIRAVHREDRRSELEVESDRARE